MKSEEAIICLGVGVSTLFAISNLMAPRDCRVVKQSDNFVGLCNSADKTAGAIAGMGSITLIGMGSTGILKKEKSSARATATMPSLFTPSQQPAANYQAMGEVERSDRSEEQITSMPAQEFNGQKQALWEKLHQEEYEWLLQLLLTKPLLVWGEQCSGKTKFSGFLAMLRQLFFGHQISVADPHAHQNSWPDIWPCYGSQYNYGAIEKRLAAYYERLKNGNQPHTSIWDEVTNYAENCDEKLAGRFLKSILSDVRKPPEFPILLSHSNTLNSLGGGKGGVKTMQIRGLVEVNLRAKRDRLGNLQPALKGTVTGLKFDDYNQPIIQQIELEPWMQPDWLMAEFSELTPTAKSDVEKLEGAWVTNEKQQVLRLINEGLTQTEIIKEVWGVKPGESSRYDEAVKRFKQYNQEV